MSMLRRPLRCSKRESIKDIEYDAANCRLAMNAANGTLVVLGGTPRYSENLARRHTIYIHYTSAVNHGPVPLFERGALDKAIDLHVALVQKKNLA